MRHEDLMALLAETVPSLVPDADGARAHCWTFAPIPQRRDRATVRVGDRWIEFEASLAVDTDPLRRLRMQSALPSVLEVVCRRGVGTLCAQIPVLAQTAAARDWLRHQTKAVHHGLCQTLGNGSAPSREHVDSGGEFEPIVLAERCTTGGWQATVSRDHEVRVEFTSRSLPRTIVLSAQDGGIRAAVTLQTPVQATQAHCVQRALATFLLGASQSLRGVRSFAVETGDAIEATGFESWLAVPADDGPLLTLLDALSTACELYGREAEALASDEALARQYLALCAPEFAADEIPERPVPHGGPPAPRAAAAFATT